MLVGPNFFNNDRRRFIVGFNSGLDRDHASDSGKPDSPIFAFPTRRLGDAIALNANEAVRFSKRGGADELDRSPVKILEILLAHPENARPAAHPKVPEIVLH